MTSCLPDLVRTSDWLQFCFNKSEVRQIWVVTRHQYEISVLVPQTSFRRETSDDVTKCWLFTQAKRNYFSATTQTTYYPRMFCHLTSVLDQQDKHNRGQKSLPHRNDCSLHLIPHKHLELRKRNKHFAIFL